MHSKNKTKRNAPGTPDALVSIDNFARLEIITDELYIADNPMLSSITGFGALESVGEVKIDRNPDLSSIAGLQQLSSVSDCRLLLSEFNFTGGGLAGV